VTDADPLLNDPATSTEFEPAQYALSAVVYAERGNEILLLQRAEGSAMAGQWFLPGGFVEPGELPEEGARRELFEEGGVRIEGDLEIVGCYPMHIYGHNMLQISFRGRVADGDVTISHEHDGARWVTASDMRALLADEVIAEMAGGSEDVARLLAHIRTDLDRYLARVAST
jgi:8-oxo-dGTP diphosphatase